MHATLGGTSQKMLLLSFAADDINPTAPCIYIRTYRHTDMQYMHACMHACMHAYIHTYILYCHSSEGVLVCKVGQDVDHQLLFTIW